MSGDAKTDAEIEPRPPYVMKTAAQREELAQEIWAGRIFTSQHVRDPDDIARVFMPLALLDGDFHDWVDENKIVVLYEEMSKAGPTSLNGYPIFFSMKMLSCEDAVAIFNRAAEIEAFMKARIEQGAQ